MLARLTKIADCCLDFFSPGIPITYQETHRNADGNKKIVLASSYFILKHVEKELDISFRIIVTFGEERLPFSHKENYKKTARTLFKNNAHVHAVTEIYYQNHSNKEITLQPLLFIFGGALSEKPFVIEDYQLTVTENTEVVTPGIVNYSFYLQHDFDVVFNVLVDGKHLSISGKAERLTQDL